MRRGLASGRDEAKRLIGSGEVLVAGSSLVKASTLVGGDDPIVVAAGRHPWVSRGGVKLAHALAEFDIHVAGKRALDVGASTGGFTDVLLSEGAAHVTALDVGYGQLDWGLRGDDRVEIRDRVNFRTVEPESLGPGFDVVVVDVSFISVTLLAERLAAVGTDTADYVVLVKPQFEAGRRAVGRGGVVSDPAVYPEVIARVRDALDASGLGSVGLIRSPITGAKGNLEFLLHARPDRPNALTADAIESVVTE